MSLSYTAEAKDVKVMILEKLRFHMYRGVLVVYNDQNSAYTYTYETANTKRNQSQNTNIHKTKKARITNKRCYIMYKP